MWSEFTNFNPHHSSLQGTINFKTLLKLGFAFIPEKQIENKSERQEYQHLQYVHDDDETW